jgi:hypothetical protein
MIDPESWCYKSSEFNEGFSHNSVTAISYAWLNWDSFSGILLFFFSAQKSRFFETFQLLPLPTLEQMGQTKPIFRS